MDVVVKICGIALVGVMASAVLKKSAPEMSAVATAALVLAMTAVAAGAIDAVIEVIYEISENAGISEELLHPLIKCVGISIVTRVACDMCRDGGLATAASYVELVGGAVAVTVAAPLMITVLRQISA